MAVQMRTTGNERPALLTWWALLAVLDGCAPRLEKRIKAQGGTAWRDFRLMQSLAYKFNKTLTESIPAGPDARWANHNRDHARFRVEIPGPVTEKQYAYIEAEDLKTLTMLAGQHNCAMCLNGGKEAAACPLRKALENTTPLPEGNHYQQLCQYATDVDWDTGDLLGGDRA